MAELITVFACDDCGKTIGLKSSEDWQQFGDTWADSLRHQFCDLCKGKIENRAAIETDLLFLQNFVMNPETEESSKEYVH